MSYAIYWDNGKHACGTFDERFHTETDAQSFADNWANERNLKDLGMTPEEVDACGGEDCYTAEVIEVEDTPEPDSEELLKRELWE